MGGEFQRKKAILRPLTGSCPPGKSGCLPSLLSISKREVLCRSPDSSLLEHTLQTPPVLHYSITTPSLAFSPSTVSASSPTRSLSQWPVDAGLHRCHLSFVIRPTSTTTTLPALPSAPRPAVTPNAACLHWTLDSDAWHSVAL